MANDLAKLFAASSIVAAFGTAILMPAIRIWNDMTVFWWLCFVVTVAAVASAGRAQLSWGKRLWVTLPSAVLPLLYVGLNILVLDRTFTWSGLKSSNPVFWRLVAAFFVGTWFFTWLFSFSKGLFATVIKWIDSEASEARVTRVSRTITAVVGLLGALGLLARAFFVSPE